MKSNFKKKWVLILRKIRERFILYLSVGIIILVAIGAFFIYRGITNKKAYDKFHLATLSYQKAQESTDIKEKLEEYKKASKIYEEIISKYPLVNNKREILLYLGDCLYSVEDYDEAEKILRKFINKYKNDYFTPWVKIKLSFLYEEKKDYEKAIGVYQDILKEYPGEVIAPQGLLGIARCLELQKKWGKAQDAYQKLLTRYPLSNEALIAVAQLERLRGEGKI